MCLSDEVTLTDEIFDDKYFVEGVNSLVDSKAKVKPLISRYFSLEKCVREFP